MSVVGLVCNTIASFVWTFTSKYNVVALRKTNLQRKSCFLSDDKRLGKEAPIQAV